MRRINLIHIGLVCAAVLFSAGALVGFKQSEIYIIVGGILVLIYWPLLVYVQRRIKPDYKFKDGIKEYSAVFVFVMLLVGVTFVGTKDYLDASMSEFVKQSGGF